MFTNTKITGIYDTRDWEENGENAPAEENDGYAFADETDGTGSGEDNGGDAFMEETDDTVSAYENDG